LGEKITLLKGMEGAAFLFENKIETEPGFSYEIATVTFLKSNLMAQLMIWKKTGAATEIAKNVTKNGDVEAYLIHNASIACTNSENSKLWEHHIQLLR
jgi:hypothetical protein